jgi:hypothetical protein
MDPLERDRRYRQAIDLLMKQGPSVSLTVTGLLVELGFDAPTAWRMVERTIDAMTVEAGMADPTRPPFPPSREP